MWSRDEDGRWHPPNSIDTPTSDDTSHLDDAYRTFESNDSYKNSPLSIRFFDSPDEGDDQTASNDPSGSTSYQHDDGSNTTCLGYHHRHLLHNIRYIEPILCDTAKKDGTVNIITIGTIYLKNEDGVLLPTTAYLSKDLPVSIISPNAILREHMTTFVAYQHYANIDTKKGFLRFIAREGPNVTFPLSCHNLFVVSYR